MANLVEVTESETVELIRLSDRDNALPLSFGGNRVWLDLDVATNKFTDHLKKMRRERRTSQIPSTGSGGAA